MNKLSEAALRAYVTVQTSLPHFEESRFGHEYEGAKEAVHAQHDTLHNCTHGAIETWGEPRGMAIGAATWLLTAAVGAWAGHHDGKRMAEEQA